MNDQYMNLQHLKIISNRLQFQLAAESVQRIPSGPGGGHLCWKIKSGNKMFFVKQLDPMLDVNDKKIIARYELCESTAFRFRQYGIPAVPAIRNGEKTVTAIEDKAYLVYPWVEGYQLDNEISVEHAIKISEILAKIHVINLNLPEIDPKLDVYSNDEIVKRINDAVLCESTISNVLMENQEMILSINDMHHAAISVLKEKMVITHGDIFKHNVIWLNPE